MILLSDIGQVEAHFGLFGDNVNLNARLVHGFGTPNGTPR
jgi:hypothetical protein